MIKRSEKVAFFGVTENDKTVYKRMTGFTRLSVSKNPKTYTRQYIDEDFEHSDIVGYQTTVNYQFDRFDGNGVHDEIVKITDDEVTGDDSIREIIMVDLSDNSARKRNFAVIPDTEGDSFDAYTYSGSFKATGEIVSGTASSEDGFKTITFTES